MSGPTIQSVAVFCGASLGNDPVYAEAAHQMGKALAARGWRLVYGGGSSGLMGVLANAALAAGGEVHGVITRHLADKELAHKDLHNLTVVQTMSERKDHMSLLADAFVSLPGGYGTLDECFNALTQSQLGLKTAAHGVLNTNGFFAPLLTFLDGVTDAQFLQPLGRKLLCSHDNPATLLEMLEATHNTPYDRWQNQA